MAAPNFTPLFQPIFVAAEDNHGPNDIDACIRLLNEQLEAYRVGPYRPVVTETDMDPSINAVVDALNFSSATITAGLNKLIASFVELQQTTKLFPLRIANGCASPDTPLLYPDGHVGGPPGFLPITKKEALCITGMSSLMLRTYKLTSIR
ncbi:uncharacterized protein ARMOST_13871 [Armillaria ostoyae]|uniref:Uncharacterized protein n=1 Tax=Armillaria ostoyae TaxID=47428 RepID=A0A284RP39_ARMOS|nr:uncharacterized protein ARMOST_13871 [Armillaria ostoyae]